MKEQLLNQVETIVAKAEIAYYEQFLVLPHCFRKSHLPYRRQMLVQAGKG